jgi:hypothetical protein
LVYFRKPWSGKPWYILGLLWQIGIFMLILPSFGIFLPILVCCQQESGSPELDARMSHLAVRRKASFDGDALVEVACERLQRVAVEGVDEPHHAAVRRQQDRLPVGAEIF